MQFIIITTAKDRDGQNKVNTSKSKVSFFVFQKVRFFSPLPRAYYINIYVHNLYTSLLDLFGFKGACSRSVCVCVRVCVCMCVYFSLYFFTPIFSIGLRTKGRNKFSRFLSQSAHRVPRDYYLLYTSETFLKTLLLRLLYGTN